ncbi:MAG TPA: hypothetical protein VE992_06405 [Solirubrobacteraceae bacterium]|nr:hypothetical protein [Solirubrobacteraceae bacterium]
MAGFVDSTVKDIDARVQELRTELARLEAARTALLGGSRRGGASSATGGATRTGRSRGRRAGGARGAGGRRGRRGGNTRATQALELVRERPGITIPEIAQRMGIEPNYLYRVMPRLVTDGQVRREGQGWHPAG